ncbi:hypothetical protein RA26_21945, partial [Leisingera sp. ANG-M7]
AGKLADLVAHFKTAGGCSTAAPAAPAKPAAAPALAPTAHGSDDWDMQPAPQLAAVAPSDGNAARDLWQDF